ncbi:recombinase family protein [Corticicoccus populi]|uniref:Recombinase family protein n=1 Tax=Corticicoccus populi TaxID=1812821 RepID=A0ABW5WX39_9STAP
MINDKAQGKTIKVAIYARVSTEMQAAEGYSIDAQIETLQEYCKKQGYDIYKVYTDKGLSGSNMSKRPNLLTMLEDAKHGKFNKIYVWKLSRLARNTRDLLSIVEDLQKHNVDFHSLSESFEVTTSTGMFMMQLLAAVSEYERNIIIDNVKLGQAQRAMDGLTNGVTVLGYNQAESSRDPMTVNQYEAAIVKQIFDMYEKGQGHRAIANHLNHCGYRTKKGKPFGLCSVKYILKNPIYAGKIRFNNYVDWNTKRRKGKNDNPILVDGQHESIITEKQWDTVQEMMQKRSFRPKVIGDGSNLLTGILRCPQCGSAMMAANTTNTLKDGTKKRIRYYSCQKFRAQGATACSANSVRADDIESRVESLIIELLDQPSLMKQVIEEVNERIKANVETLQSQSPQIETEIIEITEKINRLNLAIETDSDLKPMLSDRIKELNSELDAKKKNLKNLEPETETVESPILYDTQTLDNVLTQLKVSFKKENKMLIKEMYLSVIDTITFEKTRPRQIKKLTIHLKKDVGHTLLAGKQTSEDSKQSSLFSYSQGIQINDIQTHAIKQKSDIYYINE